MMTRSLDRGLLTRHVDDQWRVTCLEYPAGRIELSPHGVVTSVLVADHEGDGSSASRDAWAAAACTPEGELALVVHHGPPAILLDETGHRVAPGGGLGRACWFAAPGDRLLLLSCSAFDAAPQSLPGTSAVSARSVRAQDPEELLLGIFRTAERGAGAVIDRVGPRAVTTGGTP